MIQYPNVVSRTLDPTLRALKHVTGIHDRQLSDADVNLMQDVEDLKRRTILAEQVCSGCLSYSPFVFTPYTPLSFSIPAFSALVNGELIACGGNNSTDPTTNVVTLPSPPYYTPGSTAAPIALYVVFLEVWYQRLNPTTGVGFALDSLNAQYFYPNGCVNAPQANWIPSDVVDPFEGSPTTERVQVQWALRVAQIATTYDFTKYQFGLDPGASAAETVYGQASQSTPSVTTPYQFTNQGAVTGDPGLWRSGDGAIGNELATMDGYSYALPIAVVSQRNLGNFDVQQNPFGCASPTASGTGLFGSGVSGRYDGYFADVVYASDVVDCRSVVAFDGFDRDKLMRGGFVDTITGTTRHKIARGETPGSQIAALGSELSYQIAVSSVSIPNTDTIGAFDGYLNGFASSGGTYYSTLVTTINEKVVGTIGLRWRQNDAFTITLSSGSQATISSVEVQALVDNTVLSTRTPVLLLQGQTLVTGLGTASVTVSIAKNLIGTTYDPGVNPIYCTIGVQYPASTGMDLRHVPSRVWGGQLFDGASAKTMPVFGVSEYAVSTTFTPISPAIVVEAYNPEYSNVVFGTRARIAVAASTGMIVSNAAGNIVTSFTIPRTALSGTLSGIYPVTAVDQASGTAYQITARSIIGNQCLLQVAGSVVSTTTLLVDFLLLNTAQLAYNAPVRGVTSIEETVLGGTLNSTTLVMDSRITVVSAQFSTAQNTVVLAMNQCLLTGISGDDVNKLIWVLDSQGSIDAVGIASAVFSGGFVTLTVPSSVNLVNQTWFVVCSILPAFAPSSSLTLLEYYVPYQGEGILNRDYEIVHTEDTALVTTNGTGAAPVPGLADVYPYNRELPIVTTLPAQVSWPDSGLANTAVETLVDSNFVAKRYANVEHTLEVPVHTNDFIEPVNDDKRKSFQLVTTGAGRGFSKASPHLGFAITPVTNRAAVGASLFTTAAPITLFVNNVTGNDLNDGLTQTTALLTLTAALNLLPPVLRHPCDIQLIATGAAFEFESLSQSLATIEVGDGQIRPLYYHALANLSFTIQQAGRLVISAVEGTVGNVTIDATGFQGFGDGPTYGFFIDTTRVLFNQITFQGFVSAAVYGADCDVEFVDCQFLDNVTAASFTQGSTVIVDGGLIRLAANANGFVLSQSALVSSGTQFTVDAQANPGPFFVGTRGSAISLQTHAPSNESNVTATTVVAEAQINSSITCAPDFTSNGAAVLEANSVLSRTVAANPFSGGVTSDASSTTTTSL